MNKRAWLNWFAWWPVAYGPHIAWLRPIQRRWDPRDGRYYYREIPRELQA